MNQVESLLSEVPLVLDEDDARERERDQKLLEVRGKLASWFLEIRHDNSMKEVLFTFLSKLKEMHGQDMVFAPLPDCDTQPEPKPETLVRKASSVSSLSTQSSSGSSVAAHKLFYLCHEGTVWTVIQASCVLKDICCYHVTSETSPPQKRSHVVAVNVQTYERCVRTLPVRWTIPTPGTGATSVATNGTRFAHHSPSGIPKIGVPRLKKLLMS